MLSSDNGTMFHRMEFLSYHPDGRFNFHHLMFHEGDRLLAVLPGCVKDGAYISPAGASMGSFVTPPDLKLNQADGVVSAFLEYARAKGFKEIHLTPPMVVFHSSVNQTLEYALRYNGFIISRVQYSSVRHIASGTLSRKIRYNTGLAVRRGVTILEENDYDRFYPILLENKAKFGVSPTHTLDELKLLDRLMPGSLKLFLAELDGNAIAGTLLFLASQKCAMNFYTMHLYEYRMLYPVSLLVMHTCEWLGKLGVEYLDYGVSMDTFSSNALEPSWPLV